MCELLVWFESSSIRSAVIDERLSSREVRISDCDGFVKSDK